MTLIVRSLDKTELQKIDDIVANVCAVLVGDKNMLHKMEVDLGRCPIPLILIDR